MKFSLYPRVLPDAHSNANKNHFSILMLSPFSKNTKRKCKFFDLEAGGGLIKKYFLLHVVQNKTRRLSKATFCEGNTIGT
jgi:hypothetical protein